jgi:hypothetical protein
MVDHCGDGRQCALAAARWLQPGARLDRQPPAIEIGASDMREEYEASSPTSFSVPRDRAARMSWLLR